MFLTYLISTVTAISIYDNFEGAAYNTNNAWTQASGTPDVSTTKALAGNQSILVNNGSLKSPAIGANFDNNYYSVWFNTADISQPNDNCLKLENNSDSGLVYLCLTNNLFHYYDGLYRPLSGTPLNNTWYRFEIYYTDGNTEATYRIYDIDNNIIVSTKGNTAGSAGTTTYVVLTNGHAINTYFDLVTDGNTDSPAVYPTTTTDANAAWNKLNPITFTCNDNGGADCYDLNYSLNNANWVNVSYSGGTTYQLNLIDGNNKIQYKSTATNGNTETIKTAYHALDSTTPTTTANYTITDNNNQTLITLTCNDINSGCNKTQYMVDNNGQWFTYTTPFIFTGVGHHYFDYNSTDKAGNVETTHHSDLNSPVLLTIKYPKNIQTLIQLTEKWILTTTGGVTLNLTDLNSDRNIYVLPNVVTTFYISDVNGNYTQNIYTRTYYADSNNGTTDILQPYLYSITTSLATTIYTKDAYTSQPIPNVTIKIYGNLPGIGNTLIGQVTTDSKGQALALFIVGQSYTFDVYYGGALIKTYNITASSSAIYIYLYLPGTVTQPTQTGYGIKYTPTYTGINKSTVGTIVFTQTITNADRNSTTYISRIIDSGGNILSTTTSTNSDATKVFTHTINWSDINKGTLISRVSINGRIYYQNYSINDSFGSNYNIITGLSQGLRSDASCSATGVCFPLMVVGIIISIILVVGMALMLGQFQTQASGFIFVVGIVLFTYLTWIPIELTAVVVIIMLAFLVNERRN